MLIAVSSADGSLGRAQRDELRLAALVHDVDRRRPADARRVGLRVDLGQLLLDAVGAAVALEPARVEARDARGRRRDDVVVEPARVLRPLVVVQELGEVEHLVLLRRGERRLPAASASRGR